MANPRLMVDSPLYAGVHIFLDEGQSRHVALVLRRRNGDTLRLFNAGDGEWLGKITSHGTRTVGVEVLELLREARTTPDLDLLFAPVKRHATDLIVEKATELGVRRIRPVVTQRTIAETVRVDRLQSIAREAAEQTERFEAPEICEALPLAKALDGWDTSRRLIYADGNGEETGKAWGGETGRAAPIGDALRTSDQRDAPHPPTPSQHGRGGKLALLIGPEGGFTQEERRMLRALPYVIPVSLGPRILRAETAVIAALSVIQAIWGDWREP